MIGLGNSGCDIAVELSTVASQVQGPIPEPPGKGLGGICSSTCHRMHETGTAHPFLAVPPGLPELPKRVLGDEPRLGQWLPLGHAGHHSFPDLAGEHPPSGAQRLAVRERHEPVLQA